MKTIKNSDIRFEINSRIVYVPSFEMKFYTVNQKEFFFKKTNEDVEAVEEESGDTKYYIDLDWQLLKYIGKGVLNYQCTNNIADPSFPDGEYNQLIEKTTDYFIDTFTVEPEGDESITEMIEKEVEERKEADTVISGAVDTEIERAQSAETALQEAINDEVSARTQADETLQNNIDAEASARTTADETLNNAITAETSARVLADEAISQAIVDEASTRTSADEALQTAINNEATARTSADEALSGAVDTKLQDYYLKSETSGKTEIQTALDGKSDTGHTHDERYYKKDETSGATELEAALNRKLDATAYTPTDLSNYYTKSEVDEMSEVAAQGINDLNTNKLDVTAYTPTDLSNYYQKSETSGATELSSAFDAKQDTLIAGDNITISGNVISASGGGSVTIDPALDSGSTNAVENGAIWSATTYNKEVTLEFDNSSLHFSTNFPSGCTTVKVTVPNGTGYILVNFYSGSTNYIVGSANIEKYGSTPSVSMYFTDASYTIENNDVIITYPASKNVDKVGVNISGLQGAIVKAVVEGAFVNENTYMSAEVDGKIKALDDKKLDATAYTPVVVDSQLNAASTNPVQNQALYDELVIEGAEEETTLTFTGTSYNYQSTNYPSGCTKVKINVSTNNYDDIRFYNSSNHQLGDANISNYGTLSVSLSFNGASYSIVDGVAIITYPTVSNVSYIKKNQDVTTVKAVTTQTTHLIDQVTANTTALSGKQDALVSGTNIKTINNVSILGEGNIDIQGGGNNVVELTQAEYDALTTKDPDTFYVITDATPIDLSNYFTSAQTVSAITEAVSGKQDTLVSGTNIKTINNESILGEGNIDIQGGGKAIEAGIGIAITTGETADTINCTLPISADTRLNGTNLILFNYENTINHNQTRGNFIVGYNNDVGSSFDPSLNNYIFGSNNSLNKGYQGKQSNGNFVAGNYNKLGENYGEAVSFCKIFGNYLNPKNNNEILFGQYNNSVSATTTFGDSGNTLFSVGNGTADNARHNAFEIRQNGDIYITSGGTDIKLQDNLGGGSSVTVVQTTGTSTTDVMSQDAVTTALSGKQGTLTTGHLVDITNGTISVDLPISAGTSGTNSLIIGDYSHNSVASGDCAIASGYDNMAYGNNARADGYGTYASGDCAHSFGYYTNTTHEAEFGLGKYNVSRDINNGEDYSIFTVGNGTSMAARHNAFEVRNSGDIYITSGNSDIKLQDYLGGVNSSTVQTMIDNSISGKADTTAVTTTLGNYYKKSETSGASEITQALQAKANGSDVYLKSETSSSTEITVALIDKADTSAVTAHTADTTIHVTSANKTSWDGAVTASAANTTALGGLKLQQITQSAYDALATKDASTLYVIVN